MYSKQKTRDGENEKTWILFKFALSVFESGVTETLANEINT